MVADLLYGLLPEHLLLALLVVLMLIEIVGRGGRLAGGLFLLATGAGCVILGQQLAQGYAATPVPGEVSIDQFALVARMVILGCGFVYGACSLGGDSTPKFWMLVTSSLLGGSIMMGSVGFITLFLGIELLSLPAFALIVHRSGLSDAAEGAIKYLLLSAVASAMILFGISLAYGTTGTLLIADFVKATGLDGALPLTAGILLLSGFFLKSAVFPFHGWAPDAYAGARLQVTTLLASIVKAAVVLGLVRVFGNTALSHELTGVVVILGIASIFYGNITAIRQGSFKRLLAYSSIAHAGYMIFAFADTTGARSDALLYYLAVYALTTIVACACFALLSAEGNDDLDQLDGAFARRPLPALLLALAVLSMAGLPPLPGFLAKFYIFKAVVASGYLLPAVLAFAGSVVGATFYLGIVYRLFKPVELPSEIPTSGRADWAWGGIILGSVILIMFTVAPGGCPVL